MQLKELFYVANIIDAWRIWFRVEKIQAGKYPTTHSHESERWTPCMTIDLIGQQDRFS